MDLVTLLINSNALINIQDNTNLTPFDYSNKLGFNNITHFLILNGATSLSSSKKSSHSSTINSPIINKK